MMLNANMQKMYYANQDKLVPIYETDEDGNILYYEDEDGNKYPYDTGEVEIVYGEPTEFFGNISMSSSGEAEPVEYGIDISSYSAILVLGKGLIPLTENSLIWHTTEPTRGTNGYVDEYSADYKVVKVSPSLNTDKYVLQRVVK